MACTIPYSKSLAMMNSYTAVEELKGLSPPIKGLQKQLISLEIERIYSSCHTTTYIEACIEFADVYSYDLETIPNLISQTLKDRIEAEAINARTLKHKRQSQNDLCDWI